MPFPTTGEIYTIKKNLFENTYRKSPRSECVLTEREALSEWKREATTSRAGRLYRSCKPIMAIPPADLDFGDKRAERPQTREPAELEAGSSRGRPSPHDSKPQVEQDAQSASSAYRGPMFFCFSAEDDTAPLTATGHANFDELARLAIAAGVDRSEVLRLARADSKRLPTPPQQGAAASIAL